MISDAGVRVFAVHGNVSKQVKKRRTHHKTATGCLACRAKKVKCDEEHPECVRCTRNGRSCLYGGSKAPTLSEQLPDTLTSLLFKHCQEHWQEIYDIPDMSRTSVIAAKYPVLHKSLMALSAGHLRRVKPSREHRIAEHQCSIVALQECQTLMSDQSRNKGQNSFNAMVLSALLLSRLSFVLAEPEDEHDLQSSWVFSDDENRLGWLTLQGGIRHLLKSSQKWSYPAMDFLRETFLGTADMPAPWRTTDAVMPPELWCDFFKIDQSHVDRFKKGLHGDSRGDLFYPAVCNLMKAPGPAERARAIYFMPFLLKITPEMRSLLYVRDPKALWLLGYWFALLSHCEDAWWVKGRANRDYNAIRLYLEQARPQWAVNEAVMWDTMLAELDTVKSGG